VFGNTGGVYLTQVMRIQEIMAAIDANARSKQKKPANSDYYKAFDGWACIDRTGGIYTQKNPKIYHGN